MTTRLSAMLAFWPYGSAKAVFETQTAVFAERPPGTQITDNMLVSGGFTGRGPRQLPAATALWNRQTIMAISEWLP